MKNLVDEQSARALLTKQAFEEILNDDEDRALLSFVHPGFDFEKSKAPTMWK
jgi:hypothetical protein